MKNKFILALAVTVLGAANLFGQVAVPRESNRQEVAQEVGDAKITIVYHRPNTKGRANIFGCRSTDVIPKSGVTYPCLVPSGQIWRTGANDATTIEFTTDVTINGKALAAGKYAFFAIPEDKEWTLIFSKTHAQWGSYSYKAEDDVLRVMTTPAMSGAPRETLMYEFDSISGNSTNVVLTWDKMRVPFTVNVGDINTRVVGKFRDAAKSRKADDVRPLNQGAGFIFSNKIKGSYTEALGWLEESIAVKETFANLNTKARLLAEMGKKAEAISTAEKAVSIGKSSTPPANANAIAGLEAEIAKWKK